MKASYKLQLEQHQRRLGLTHKELNKLDRKHNDINLLKQLQLLEPKVSASFNGVGTIEVTNVGGESFISLTSGDTIFFENEPFLVGLNTYSYTLPANFASLTFILTTSFVNSFEPGTNMITAAYGPADEQVSFTINPASYNFLSCTIEAS